MKHHPTMSPSSLPIKKTCPVYESGSAGKAAESGIRQHTALEDVIKGRKISVKLNKEESESVNWGYHAIKDIVESEGLKMSDGESEIFVDVQSKEFDEITFGTIDFAIGNMIFDYKSGEVRNYREQMLAYAIGWWQKTGESKIRVYEVYGKKEYVNTYEFVDMFELLEELEGINKKVNAKDKIPVVNEYCGWCKHKNKCEVRMGIVKKATVTNYDSYLPEKATDEELANMKDVSTVIAKWAKEVDAELKKRLEKGEISGYFLKERKGSKSVSDVAKAFELSGLDSGKFVSACKVSLPKLGEALSDVEGLTKKSGRELIESRLKEVIEVGKPSQVITKK